MANLFISLFLLFCHAQALAIEIYAHRGGAGLLPENSLEAIEASLHLGVDVIDVDVGLTKDHIVVAYHDPKLNPDYTRNAQREWLTHPTPAIIELSYAHLQQYDVGRIDPNSHYGKQFPYQTAKQNVQIPSLEQVIRLIKKSGWPVRLQVEIKTDPNPEANTATPRAIVERLVEVLRKEQFTKQTEVHSFDWRSLIILQEIAPEIASSYLSDNALLSESNYSEWLANHDIKRLNISFPQLINKLGGKIWCPHYADLTADLLQEARSLGLKVNVWTVDEPHDMLSMIALGVDGIITNRPDILRGMLAASGHATNPLHVCSNILN